MYPSLRGRSRAFNHIRSNGEVQFPENGWRSQFDEDDDDDGDFSSNNNSSNDTSSTSDLNGQHYNTDDEDEAIEDMMLNGEYYEDEDDEWEDWETDDQNDDPASSNSNDNNDGPPNYQLKVLPHAQQSFRPNCDHELESFMCAICHELLDNPVGCGRCSGRFCGACLKQHYDMARTNRAPRPLFIARVPLCPTCREPMRDGLVKDDFLRARMGSELVPCRYADCGLNLIVDQMKRHEQHFCPGVTVQCKYATLGCPWTGTKSAARQHLAEECLIGTNPGLLLLMERTQTENSNLRRRVRQLEQSQEESLQSLRSQMNLVTVQNSTNNDAVHSLLHPRYQHNHPWHLLQLLVLALVRPVTILQHRHEWRNLIIMPGKRAIVHNFFTLMPSCLLALKLCWLGLHAEYIFWNQTICNLSEWGQQRVITWGLQLLTMLQQSTFNKFLSQKVMTQCQAYFEYMSTPSGASSCPAPESYLSNTADCDGNLMAFITLPNMVRLMSIPCLAWAAIQCLQDDSTSPTGWRSDDRRRRRQLGRRQRAPTHWFEDEDIDSSDDDDEDNNDDDDGAFGKSEFAAALFCFYGTAIPLLQVYWKTPTSSSTTSTTSTPEENMSNFEDDAQDRLKTIILLLSVIYTSLVVPSILICFLQRVRMNYVPQSILRYGVQFETMEGWYGSGGNALGPLLVALAYSVGMIMAEEDSLKVTIDAFLLWYYVGRHLTSLRLTINRFWHGVVGVEHLTTMACLMVVRFFLSLLTIAKFVWVTLGWIRQERRLVDLNRQGEVVSRHDNDNMTADITDDLKTIDADDWSAHLAFPASVASNLWQIFWERLFLMAVIFAAKSFIFMTLRTSVYHGVQLFAMGYRNRLQDTGTDSSLVSWWKFEHISWLGLYILIVYFAALKQIIML